MPRHVLLVEPDVVEARTVMQALQRQGYSVVHALSAQAAIQMADVRVPDVVVLELQLPRHNGVEFLYEFRSYPEWLTVPVVTCSYTPKDELTPITTLSCELGVVRVLHKPETSLAALCAAVAEAKALA